MTAQDATKSRKNAKERRAKNKEGGGKKSKAAARTEKGGATTSEGPKGSLVERIVRYWKGVVAETKRVSWPSKPELIAGTITSVFILLVFAGWLGGLDWILARLLAR